MLNLVQYYDMEFINTMNYLGILKKVKNDINPFSHITCLERKMIQVNIYNCGLKSCNSFKVQFWIRVGLDTLRRDHVKPRVTYFTAVYRIIDLKLPTYIFTWIIHEDQHAEMSSTNEKKVHLKKYQFSTLIAFDERKGLQFLRHFSFLTCAIYSHITIFLK